MKIYVRKYTCTIEEEKKFTFIFTKISDFFPKLPTSAYLIACIPEYSIKNSTDNIRQVNKGCCFD